MTERMSEEQVDACVARAQRGDERAFQELFIQYREMVARVVHRTMGPSPEIEDVVQDVFVHVFRSIAKFRGESKFTTWLYRLASNVTKMHLRKKKSRPRTVDVPMPERHEGAEATATPDQVVDRDQRIEALYRLVDQLSDKKREVLVLHDFEGISATEIAERVDVPVLTVRTRLFYARKELYAALGSEPALAALAEEFADGRQDVKAKAKAKKQKRSASKKRERRESSESALERGSVRP